MKALDRLKTKTNNLLLIAAIVWAVAGINILIIGLREYAPYWSWVNVLLSIAIFAVFQTFIFGRLVKKHTLRITGYTEETEYFWKFFDLKSFIIMAFMITLGVILRNTPAVPRVFIAVFYTGIGSSLLLAGILFGRNYIGVRRENDDSVVISH